jgi:hypothetical protein
MQLAVLFDTIRERRSVGAQAAPLACNEEENVVKRAMRDDASSFVIETRPVSVPVAAPCRALSPLKGGAALFASCPT